MWRAISKNDYFIFCTDQDVDTTFQQHLCRIMASNDMGLGDFSEFYFPRYGVLFDLAHVIRHSLGVERDHEAFGAEQDYFANLFAVKYLQNKKEDVYLKRLSASTQWFLDAVKASFSYDLSKLNQLYGRYKSDIITDTALQFKSIQECLKDKRDFADILRLITDDHLVRLNSSILTRPTISGQDLIQECLEIVFGMQGHPPSIQYSWRMSQLPAVT